MAIKTFHLLNTTATAPFWGGSMQDGGTAPAAALSAFGWTVAKTATTFWNARIGATARTTEAQASSWIGSDTAPGKGTGSGATTAGDSFVSPTPYFGNFAAGNWTLNFGMRSGATGNAGRICCRIWAGANADGTGAREIAGGRYQGSTVTFASTTATYNSQIVASLAAITLANEYLFFQVEWERTTTGGSNSCTAQFYQSAGTIVTPDFVSTLNVLDPNDYTTPVPTLQSAALTQKHALLDLDLVTAAPVLEDADLVEVSAAFPTNPLVAPAPVLQTATLTQTHAVATAGLTAPAPVIGTPPLVVVRNLTASGLTAPIPTLATPTTTQKHVVVANTLLSPAPTFEAPSLMLVSALKLGDRVLDNGLAALDTEADRIYICNNFPTTYIEATSTFALGNKIFGVGQVFSAPAPGAPKGRVVMSNTVSGGTISAAGMPQCWAVVDTVNARLLAIGPASGFTAVSLQWTWTLGTIPIHMDG